MERSGVGTPGIRLRGGRAIAVTAPGAQATVAIVDARGRTLRVALIINEGLIDLTGLARGSYIATVKSGGRTSMDRVLVR